MRLFSKTLALFSIAALLAAHVPATAQVGGGTGGGQIVNAVTTAVPFLRINPDARSGGMGDAGLASSPDPSSVFFNPAKLAHVNSDLGFTLSYTPWLRALVNDIYMANASLYARIDKMQSIGGSLRYFSLGQIQFTGINGEEMGQFRPHEFAVDFTYSRKLSDKFSTGASLRFIYSNLATGQVVSGQTIRPAIAAAADIAFYYQDNFNLGDKKAGYAFGLAFTNVGSKVTYTESAFKDFIPMNLGLGGRFTYNLDDYNQLNIVADINKLLVPTPDPADPNAHRAKSVPAGLFGSFGDAPGGFSEEMRELMFSMGIEYWYDQMFAVRVGHFNEHATKGNRKFFTAGLGVKYSVFGLDFSYLIPTSNQRNPLDNTLRFSLQFDFAQMKKDKAEAAKNEPQGF